MESGNLGKYFTWRCKIRRIKPDLCFSLNYKNNPSKLLFNLIPNNKKNPWDSKEHSQSPKNTADEMRPNQEISVAR